MNRRFSPLSAAELPDLFVKKVSVGREAPPNKKRKLEMVNLKKKAIEEGVKSYEDYSKNVSFSTFEEFKLKVGKYNFNACWTIIVKEAVVLFILIKEQPNPVIQCSVIVPEQLSVQVYFKNLQISKLDRPLPEKVVNLNEIDNIINNCHKRFYEYNNDNNTTEQVVDVIESCLDLLKEKSEDNVFMCNFFKEQISLLNVAKNKVRYSSDYLVFCSIFQGILPHA